MKYHEEKKHEEWRRIWIILLVCDGCEWETEVKTEVVTPKNDVWPRCEQCDKEVMLRKMLKSH